MGRIAPSRESRAVRIGWSERVRRPLPKASTLPIALWRGGSWMNECEARASRPEDAGLIVGLVDPCLIGTGPDGREAVDTSFAETAMIADEAVQELTATLLGGAACRSWLARPVPDVAEAAAAIEDAIAAARRAGELVQRLRQAMQDADPRAVSAAGPRLDRL